jgi:hypothetical protein
MVAKKLVVAGDLASQTAIELPARETPATAVVNCVAVCIGSITVQNVSIPIAVQVCAVANVLSGILGAVGGAVTCSLTR